MSWGFWALLKSIYQVSKVCFCDYVMTLRDVVMILSHHSWDDPIDRRKEFASFFHAGF